jgi:cytoskeletal protein RodZ
MGSFGENLRRERELRGVSLREIADSTKISVRFLEALENDRLEILPGGVFRRAFVREYARHLGLDAERTVAEFVYAHPSEEHDPPAKAGPAVPNRSARILGGFLAVLVPLLVAKLGRERPPAPPAPPPLLQVEPVHAAAAPAVSVEEAPALQDGLALTLSAREACWVMVSADGQAVLNRVLGRGESQTIQARGEIVLSVGNAGGLEISVDDKPGLALGKSGEVRRNIVITRESLPALVEEASRPAPSHSS